MVFVALPMASAESKWPPTERQESPEEVTKTTNPNNQAKTAFDQLMASG